MRKIDATTIENQSPNTINCTDKQQLSSIAKAASCAVRDVLAYPNDVLFAERNVHHI